ncbi:ATP-binding SpoIIE family protein phosphatase [Embleya scabrispora]|uniref:ATP-binding SpoIIE family protein phosphatase n=1 Tax=Embleya scabrispora TaxID=159449 RepID=UPI0003686CE3|nr:SpoIIE family protein phosphatase [Embleya scabrispora]MYS85824.1 SpoIIE family protein phosphatase [Streptomyces sp. SID5474]
MGAEDEVERLRLRVRLMYEAAARIGAHLDLRRTTQDIVDVVVPALGKLATVDLYEAVSAGEDAVGVSPPPQGMIARFAVCGDLPEGMITAGERVPSLSIGPYDAALTAGNVAVIEDAWGFITSRHGVEPARQMVPDRVSRGIVAPLFARGRLLGVLIVWQDRARAMRPDDVEILQEIALRGGLAVDNARRYAREHATAVGLQRMLLPRGTTDTDAAETTAIYRPAGEGAGVGGEWFDVIPLSSARIGLVVGEAFGRGLVATATMGRVRAAMLTLAHLDLEPDELLTHVDDLVRRLGVETEPGADPVGARCVYAVYDPVTSRCVFADAGHHAPLLVAPDREPALVELPPGPPLGVGGTPFETAELELGPSSVLVFAGSGFLDRQGDSAGAGPRRLRRSIARRCRAGRSMADVSRDVVKELAPDGESTDVVLLCARMRSISPANTVRWVFPARAEAVPEIRRLVTGQLAVWQLDEEAFATELVISELAGNAVRYGGDSMTVRLIRGKDLLVCEVGDGSSTQPRIRRARSTDEGGRGLFLVSQVTERWGCRFGPDGKTIWAEQQLDRRAGSARG